MDQDVLQMDNAVEKTDGKEGGEGNDESDGAATEPDTGRNKLYIFLDCAKAVAELTRFNFERVFRMPVIEFFAYVAYVNFDTRRRERELQKINRKYGH